MIEDTELLNSWISPGAICHVDTFVGRFDSTFDQLIYSTLDSDNT